MIISERWLREWVDPDHGTEALAERLTMGGLEVDSVTRGGPELPKVVVGQVLEVEPHPRAPRLKVCRVDVGRSRALRIVCGAPNVALGAKAPTALIGAVLPGGQSVEKVRIRDVVSSGMLCSSAELGLDDDAAGLLLLDAGAEVGLELAAHLGLDDPVIEVELTPNRGDCLSILGVAREVSALTGTRLKLPAVPAVKAHTSRRFPIRLDSPEDCPRYVGRVIEAVDYAARTPDWIRERLRRSGVRPISAIVDVTNYVMLELGQPMHAFDLDQLRGGIVVRRARAGERVPLLDGSEVTADPDTLLIADHEGGVALAGIMGGAGSAIGPGTENVLLESAFFRPQRVGTRARAFGMQTDASFRFERGVDPEHQVRAVERATALLIEVAGGRAGPVLEAVSRRHLPKRRAATVRHARVERMLGVELRRRAVTRMLQGLGMTIRSTSAGWRVTPPPHRFDIEAEHDVVEEVARIYGYDRIPVRNPGTGGTGVRRSEARGTDRGLRAALVGRDYQEAITYSFVDPGLQRRLDPAGKAPVLANPIASNMAVMRTTLLAGLLPALVTNFNRQHRRIRLFEIGHSYRATSRGSEEGERIAAVVTGPVVPEQWGADERPVDFYDVKADVEVLLGLGRSGVATRFQAAEHPAFHPGQCAEVRLGKERVGHMGRVHPDVLRHLELDQEVFAFELDAAVIKRGRVPEYAPISRFPAVRRDLSVLVPDETAAAEVLATVRRAAGRTLKNLELFDVFRGKDIDSDRKSLAFRLTLQESSRTLRDEEAERIVARVMAALENKLGAELRT